MPNLPLPTAVYRGPVLIDPTNMRPRLKSRWEELRDLERAAGQAFGSEPDDGRGAGWLLGAVLAVAVVGFWLVVRG